MYFVLCILNNFVLFPEIICIFSTIKKQNPVQDSVFLINLRF